MAGEYDDPEYWRKPSEPLTSGTFDWLVMPEREQGFAVPVRSCTLDDKKNPISITAIVDINAKRELPKRIFGNTLAPMNNQDYLREVLLHSKAHVLPKKFELVIVDFGRSAEQWRRLQFFAMFEAVPVITTATELPPAVVEQLKSMDRGEDRHSDYSAKMQLSVFGGIDKIGDWENKQKIAAPAKTLDQKVEAAGKRIWDIANVLVDGSIELVQNISREIDNSEKRTKNLQSRQGVFTSAKPMPQLFDEVFKALKQPIGRFRWSAQGDTNAGEITAKCGWREGNETQDLREITATFLFKPSGSGTVIEYKYLVYEGLLGSVFANQLIEITNGWIESWVNASDAPPV
jgi:hypothetical protein